ASAPRLLPSAPVQLNGNTLPEAKAVATALRNNWLVHIPLSALSTKVLLTLGSSSRSQAESDQSLSVKEGVLTVLAPHLDGKSEGDMSYEDWCHAWPRLVSMIRRYLPGAGANDIANAWEAHFTSLYARYDFFANFRRYLRYDIRLRQAFVHDHSFNPAHWQTEVYEAVGRDFDSPHILAVNPLPFVPTMLPKPLPPLRPALPPCPMSNINASFVASQSAVVVRVAPSKLPSLPSTPPPTSSRHLPVSRFATSSTVLEGANLPNLSVADATCASDAGALMRLRCAHNDGFLPIVTPFIWEKWHELLDRAGVLQEFADVPKGIRFG
ncbi:hypothetical protein EDD22DRAFT_761667, partial [Suillus occidentalis]